MGVALKLVEVLCFFLKSKPFFSLFRWLPPGSYRVCLGMDPFLWKRTDLAWAATVLVHFNGGGGGGWGLKFFPSLQTSYGGLFFGRISLGYQVAGVVATATTFRPASFDWPSQWTPPCRRKRPARDGVWRKIKSQKRQNNNNNNNNNKTRKRKKGKANT